MKCVKFLLLILCSGIGFLQAQDKEWFVSVPNEPALSFPNLSNTYSFQTNNYLCWIRYTGAGYPQNLYLYDGSTWKSLPMDSLNFIIQDIDDQNDTIVYIAAPVNSVSTYVMMHDQNGWKAIKKLKLDYLSENGIVKLKFYKNKLYCISSTSKLTSELLEYDMKTDAIKTVATFEQNTQNDVNNLRDRMRMHIQNDRLYVTGAYDLANSKSAQGYGYYDGSSFTAVNIFPSSSINYSLSKALDNDMYLVERFNNVTTNDIKDTKLYLVRHDSIIADITGNLFQKIYTQTGLYYMAHDFFQVYKQNGNIHYFAKSLGHYEYDIVNKRWLNSSASYWFLDGASFFYKNKRYMFSSQARLPYSISGKCCLVMKTLPYISGYAYADMDNNCTRTSNDTLMKKTWVKLKGSNSYQGVLTDNKGWFELPVEKGKYTFINGAPVFSNATCNKDTITVDSIRPYSRDVSFSFLSPYSNTPDIKVSLNTVSLLRRGQTHKIRIKLENLGKPDITVRPRLAFDPRFTYVTSSINPSKINNQHLEFYAITVNKFKPVFIDVTFMAHQDSFAVSDTVNFIGSIDSAGTEVDKFNNIDRLCERVIGPYDPNMITANIEGEVTYAPMSILYTVEFQNMGTDTAFNVRITDTIPPRLDIGSVELLSSSGSDVSAWLSGSLLSFKLENIKLAPKTQNEPASKGYLTFRINLKNNLTPGQEVRNKAGIYFDYEKEVPTNTSSVLRINDGSSVGPNIKYSYLPFITYPNPGSNSLMIKTKSGSMIEKVQFFNIAGQELLAPGDANGNYDISLWPSGLFTVVVWMNGQQYTCVNSKL